MRSDGGYGAVLAERPIRRLLLASLSGRVAFSMLPLGFVLFGAAETGSTATAGAMVAAFALAGTPAPARGRLVDRRGPRALAAFAVACAAGILALVLAAAIGASSAVLVLLTGLAGLVVPPLGPFTRAVLGGALRDRGERLQRTFALDSAGEEAGLIVSPLVIALVAGLASPGIALLAAAGGALAATLAAGRSTLIAGPAAVDAASDAPPAPLPAALWLVFASLVPTAAALGAIDVAVPAATRAQGHVSTAGLLLAVMAVGTVAGSLLAGWRSPRWAPGSRAIVLQLVMGLGLVGVALTATRLELLAAALILPGAALGALFATLYVLVDRLAPEGSGTRTFAWLVTANNGGLALGAAVAGALSGDSGASAGLWFAAACAIGGVAPATAAGMMSARVQPRPPVLGDR